MSQHLQYWSLVIGGVSNYPHIWIPMSRATSKEVARLGFQDHPSTDPTAPILLQLQVDTRQHSSTLHDTLQLGIDRKRGIPSL